MGSPGKKITRSHLSTINQESGTIMSKWPRYSAIYVINTWVWLSSIGSKIRRAVDLGSVPTAEWDAIAKFGFEAVWLVGVWERSPACIVISNQNSRSGLP